MKNIKLFSFLTIFILTNTVEAGKISFLNSLVSQGGKSVASKQAVRKASISFVSARSVTQAISFNKEAIRSAYRARQKDKLSAIMGKYYIP
jgi:hypothetical protein